MFKSPVPIWLIGTSRGTISATAAAIHEGGQNIVDALKNSPIQRVTLANQCTITGLSEKKKRSWAWLQLGSQALRS